jgi:hypothetical protein
VVTLRANPVQYNPVTHELVVTTKFRVNVSFEGQDLRNVPPRQIAMSTSWANMVRATSFNSDDNLSDEQNTGSYLILGQNTLTTDLQPLIEWKKRKGHSVTFQTVASGATTTTIKGYIQTAYNSANPPEYVLLVGDESGTYTLAAYSISGYKLDHPYSQLDGTDILADVAVGRMPTNNQSQTQTMVNKVIFYEKMPYTTNPAWFTGATLMAGYSGSSYSMYQLSRWIKTQMLWAGYTRVDTAFYSQYGSYSSQHTAAINSLNNGSSMYSYRGWVSYGLSVAELAGLNNSRRLPFAADLTCGSGGFNGTSPMEGWLIAGTPTTLIGGIASTGLATMSTHINFNNTLSYGMFAGVCNEDITQAGNVVNRGKLELYNAYQQNVPSYVTDYSNWCAMAGDPGVELFNGAIQYMNCTVPDQITYGVNSLSLTVNKQVGGALAGATVCCYKSGALQSVGTTNANGQITMSLIGATPGSGLSNVKVTIHKHNYYPIVDSIDVVNAAVAVGYLSHTVDDDNVGGTSGDGDNVINPGETVDLPLTFKNYGTSTTATVISATASETDPYATLSNATQSFPDMAPGASGTSTGAVRLAVGASCPDGYTVPLAFNTTTNQGSWGGGLPLAIVSYDLSLRNAQFAGTDTLLSPGETANLTLTVKNVGHKNANNLGATLVSLDPLVTVNDNSATFGTINVGATANCSGNPFNLTASSTAMRGHWANLQVTYSANGATLVDTFKIKLGTKLITDPQGPDDYGYYCYDNGDVSYPQAPLYSWVECDPSYGGSGTQLSLYDSGEDQDQSINVTLPFTFRYYGQNTTQITVCTNGWISTWANVSFTDFRNYQIPSPIGPNGHICGFWQDLITSPGHVFTKNDAANHRFIIEWSRMCVLQTSTQETFEIILYDPAFYSTPTGDGEIIFQYNIISDIPDPNLNDNEYSTVGIESPDQTIGIEVVYWNTYDDPAAAHLQNSRAYKFTTSFGAVALNLDVNLTPINPPIVIPANGGSFNFNAGVTNNGPAMMPFNVWTRAKNPDGSYTVPLLGPVVISPPLGITVTRLRTQNVASTWPAGDYSYIGYANATFTYPAADSSAFPFTKSATADGGPEMTNAYCWGELFPGEEIAPEVAMELLPTAYSLSEAKPNPFNPVTSLSYQLPASGHVSLKVFDVSGRLVAKLVDENKPAGTYQISFDGSKLASGLYFVRMQAGSFNAVKKMMLVK